MYLIFLGQNQQLLILMNLIEIYFLVKHFGSVMKLSSCACILIICVIPFIFHILINDSFIEAYQYIPLLLIGSLFNVIVAFLGGIYVAKKMSKEVATTSLWSGILNVTINVLLVKRIGITAAAISTILAFAIMSIYRLIDVQKYVKLKLDIKGIIPIIILFIISIAGYYLGNTIIRIIILIIVLIASAYINRGMINSIKIMLRTKLLKSSN